MENYLINKNTLVILPRSDGKSEIIENYITYIINAKPIEIINKSCKFYGSSFLGRCESTAYLTGVRYKCPIVISEKANIIFFPTVSWQKEYCVWFNYKAIEKYYKNANNMMEILLINGKKVEVNISNHIFTSQIFKTSRLDSIMKSKLH